MRGHSTGCTSPCAFWAFVIVTFAVLALLRSTASAGTVVDSSDPSHATRNLLSTVAGLSNSAEACLSKSLSDLSVSCTATATNASSKPGSVLPWDGVVKLLQKCFFANRTETGAKRLPMRLLAGQSVYGQLVRNMTSVYSQTTGIPIQVEMPPISAVGQLRLASLANAKNYSATHEVWVVAITNTGDSLKSKSWKRLTDLVGLDPRLNWPGLLPALRTNALLYKSEVIAFPASLFAYQLAYRKDIFAQYQLPVPRTWRELLQFSRQYNGTAGMHAFCGVWSPCFQLGVVLVRSILATLTQTHGPTQGWFFDPDSMDLYFDTPAMEETLEILKGLYAISPPDNSLAFGCPTYGYRFTGSMGGQCLMSIVHPYTFKYASYLPRANLSANLQGNLGFAPWPGSETVLDRATRTMVNCTAQRCPYATEYKNKDGSAILVNQSPGLEANLYALNDYSSPDVAFFTYSVMSYLSSEETNSMVVFHPDSELFPCRPSQLDWRQWVKVGFNADDAKAFCEDNSANVNHPNINVQVRIPGAPQLTSLFGTLANKAFAGTPSADIMAYGTQAAKAILNTTYGPDPSVLKAEYYASINRVLSAAPPTATPAPPVLPAPAPGPLNSSGSRDVGVIVAAVVVPVAVVATLLGLAFRYRSKINLIFQDGRTRHPGPGPETTLCVTDIESSTLLWEELDPLVMDTSVKLHNGCIRNLAAKHKGYESVWEGDSFILAFPNPAIAIEFCMSVQRELLQLPWPSALLQSDHANEVWCLTSGASLRHRKKTAGLLQVTPSSPSAAMRSSVHKPHASHLLRGAMVNSRSKSSPVADASSGQGDNEPALAVQKPDADGIQPRAAQSLCGTETSDTAYSSSTYTPALAPYTGLASELSTASGEGGVHEDGHSSVEDMASYWRAKYRPCPPTQSGAILAYKGLRVRLGMHSGVDIAANITYNSAMGRYHYTGPVRVISNAVASAGHGGHTLMSGTTAALLDPDATGVLTRLPSDCSVYHQGLHQLKDVQDDTELTLVLPNTLRCRLGLQQDALRSLQVTTPGIMMAPVPTVAASDTTALVYVQFSGLEALLAWNAAEACTAIRQSRSALMQALGVGGGVLSEDGLVLALRGQAHKANNPLQMRHAVFGRVVMATRTFSSAVSLAVGYRNQLLMLDWSQQLLSHELCERVGSMPISDHSGQHSTAADPSPVHPVDLARKSNQSEASIASTATTRVESVVSRGVPAEAPSIGTPSSSGYEANTEHKQEGIKKRRSKRSLLNTGAVSGAMAVVTLEAPMLRGLRIRTVLLRGRGAEVSAARHSSGLAVYQGPEKVASKLLKKAKAGQILMEQACVDMRPGACAMRI